MEATDGKRGTEEQDWVGISLEMGERGEDMVAWMERQQIYFSRSSYLVVKPWDLLLTKIFLRCSFSQGQHAMAKPLFFAPKHF